MTGNISCESYTVHTKTKVRNRDKVDIMTEFVGLGFLRRMNRDAASAMPIELMKNIPSKPVGGYWK